MSNSVTVDAFQRGLGGTMQPQENAPTSAGTLPERGQIIHRLRGNDSTWKRYHKTARDRDSSLLTINARRRIVALNAVGRLALTVLPASPVWIRRWLAIGLLSKSDVTQVFVGDALGLVWQGLGIVRHAARATKTLLSSDGWIANEMVAAGGAVKSRSLLTEARVKSAASPTGDVVPIRAI